MHHPTYAVELVIDQGWTELLESFQHSAELPGFMAACVQSERFRPDRTYGAAWECTSACSNKVIDIVFDAPSSLPLLVASLLHL